ncbi:hypothetical protein EYS14_22960 [Alteromonadaceae bacterium M269]|nr:hypothetical protein EYS14_22960 [Alteromonadaceae bacterium M269]
MKSGRNMLRFKSWVGLAGLALIGMSSAQADNQVSQLPQHLSQVKKAAVQQMTISGEQLLTQSSRNDTWSFDMSFLPSVGNLTIETVTQNRSGTYSFSSTLKQGSDELQLLFTQGKESGYGELMGSNQRLIIEQRRNEVTLINVGLAGLAPGIYENDVVGDIASLQIPETQLTSSNQASIVIDIMLLFTQNIVDTFPGEMAQTLLEHLTFKANQALVDSGINSRLRLVHTEFIGTQNPSNFVALSDLDAALDQDPNTPTPSSLQQIAALREQFGADIVAMIRTHDLNERGVCGIARFPNAQSDVLINISNVGISGGSNCLDTFTHEIGHNFGAGHQRVNDQPQGVEPAAGALLVTDKFNTVMSSIGTGDINRDFGLPVFSNPNLICGGIACGDATVANNALTVNNFSPINAALRIAVVDTVLDDILPSVTDRDGDGVFDDDDAFPFDPLETDDTDSDGVGDNADAFDNDASEQFDTDQDGMGNNTDTDDDNDGTPDINDALPLDPRDTIDADGDGVGPSIDELDNDFQDTLDFDNDNQGNRNDLDDDNDGVPDFSTPTSLANSEVWVASAGTDSILRFNAQTGNFIEPLLEVGTGGLSFRSDMVLSNSQQLFFIAFSDVIQFDRQTESMNVAIDRSQLNTNFPIHLATQGDSTLFVSNGLNPSIIQLFNFSTAGNQLTSTFVADNEFLRDYVILPNNQLLAVARDINAFISFNLTTFAETLIQTQGLSSAEHMTLDSGGNLLVTNAGSRNITRYNTNGAFLGEFISAGSGGLGVPGCITLGPDGNIYVCSSDTDQVLRFDGNTGAFIDVFVEAEAGGLMQPVSLVFAGQPLDEFRLDGEHDSDNDGVNNTDDAFPLDATETTDTDNDGIGNNADTDDDNDGMPDTFEIENNLDPLDSSDAQQDADNDGSTNLQEFLVGTDPNDPASTPAPPPPPPESSGGGSIPATVLLIGLFGVFIRRRLGA